MLAEHTEMMEFRGQLSFAPEALEAAEQMRKTPEGRLLWAVLEHGVAQYRKNATATGRRGKRLFREAEDWIMRDDSTWLCSFVNICHAVGVDPGYLRTGLRRSREVKAAPACKQAA